MSDENNLKRYIEIAVNGDANERAEIIAKASAFDMMVTDTDISVIAGKLLEVANIVSNVDERISLFIGVLKIVSVRPRINFEASSEIIKLIEKMNSYETAKVYRELRTAGFGHFVEMAIICIENNKPKSKKAFEEIEYLKWYTPISRSIAGYKYSDMTHRLWIQFKCSGETYLYNEVPKSVADDLHNSDVKGKFIQENIVDKCYSYEKLPSSLWNR